MFRKIHGCALSLARKHSSRFVTGGQWKPQGIMMSRQKELPVLPVVPLQDMLRRYVDFVEPFLAAEELKKFREVIHDFGKPGGDGEILHKLLVDRASCFQNWFSERFDEIFTKSRLPMSSTAVGVCLPRHKFTTKKGQLRQAAALAAGALDFKHLIERQLLPPEVRGTMPLDMSQYQKLFSLYHMPSTGCDIMTSNTPSQKSGEHVLVIHNCQGAPVKAGVWRVASPRNPSHAGSPAHVWLCVAFPCPGKRASWWLSRARGRFGPFGAPWEAIDTMAQKEVSPPKASGMVPLAPPSGPKEGPSQTTSSKEVERTPSSSARPSGRGRALPNPASTSSQKPGQLYEAYSPASQQSVDEMMDESVSPSDDDRFPSGAESSVPFQVVEKKKKNKPLRILPPKGS
ncbi:putative choline O-acyltransferase [Ixodes scapularis]